MNMGREHPTMVIPPGVHKRTERARRARDTVNKVIPDILRASPRARHGIHKSALVVDPAPPTQHGDTPLSSLPDAGPAIRLLCTDTLDAAARMSERPFAPRRPTSTSTSTQPPPPRPNIAILSFASPLKPGGGFLDGANSQEDFLCARSTLYPSLWPAFYRLPDLGGVHTPDVLVFRDSTPQAHERPKRDRFLVDVVSAAMLRFPAAPTTSTTRGGRPAADDAAGACSCGVSYCDGHRDLVARKMRAVLRIAQLQGVERVVLGAWGCGASGNPVAEVARLWRKVLAGSLRQRRPNSERWQGIREVVFAIPDRGMAKEFEVAFKDILAHDAPFSPSSAQDLDEAAAPALGVGVGFAGLEEPAEIADLVAQIQATEMRLDLAPHARARQRLRGVLAGLNRDLNRSLAARRLAEEEEEEELEDPLPQASEDGADDDDDGFVAVAASDGEEGGAGNSVYHFDEDDVASDSSDATAPEAFEFRPLPGLDFGASHDDDDADDFGGGEDGAGQTYGLQLLQPSPNFDAKTGWFSGSIDELQGLMRAGAVSRGGSHASPELRGQRRGMAGEGEGEGDVEELSLDRGFGQSRGGGA
ncbi:hypothetical protein LTR53_017214 [Teratosphaeriaceae sp. CCFEE 6253]|nr:hypothetical protein LTR53_017214 [Teratosphaeriaceae sp. CCFEE 6253]